jgi:hypothetical protein
LLVEELCAGDGVAGDGLVGFGAVGKAGGVTDVDVVSAGDEREKSAEDGEASEAGVEDAYGDGSCQLFGLRDEGCQLSVLSKCFVDQGCVFGFVSGLGFGWGHGFGCGVVCGIGVEEIGVAGERVVGLAVYEEADGGYLGERGVEGADDGVDGEGFDLNAGGMVVDEAAAEIDDC